MKKPLKKVSDQSDWVVVGRFGRPQGLKGFVRVISFTEVPENILEYIPWHVEIRGTWKPIKIVKVEPNAKLILVRVEGYAEREQVAVLTNCNIGVQSHQLPVLPKNDYYWRDLIGMQVSNKDGQTLGIVTEMLATGSNDVLIITGDKRYLVPYLPGEYVLEVDSEQRVIHVDWDVEF